MSDPITTSFADFDQMVRWSRTILEKLGYTVLDPSVQWMTPKSFYLEMEIGHNTFNHLTNRPDCPKFPIRRSETGRMLHIVPTPALRDFVNQHKRKNTK